MQKLLNIKPEKGENCNNRASTTGFVAYILDSFPNVSETFISNEINELLKLGWDVRIYSLHRPKAQLVHESARALISRTTYLPQPIPRLSLGASLLSLLTRNLRRTRSEIIASRSMRGKHFSWTAKQAIYLAHQVSRLKCHRIHVHFASEASRYGFFVSKYLDLPLTVTVHSPLGKNESDEDTLSAIGAAADAVITVSEFNKRYINDKFNIHFSKIFVNPNGILPEMFKRDHNIHRIPGRILTVGRLHSDKGIGYAISAAKMLDNFGVDFDWIIIGDGPERNFLESQIEILGLNKKVRLLGFQPASRVSNELQLASVFVLPSISESQGVVYLEAMATGTPVIGTNIPGVDETVINGESGVLVSVASAEEISRAIIELFENHELRQRLTKNALTRVQQHYLLSDRVKNLINIWENEK